MTDCFVKPVVERLVADRPSGQGLIKCDGVMDSHHFVKQQRIKRKFPLGAYESYDGSRWPIERDKGEPPMPGLLFIRLDAILDDDRNRAYICRKHHANIEVRAIILLRSDLPPAVEDFAQQYGFSLDEDFGPRE